MKSSTRCIVKPNKPKCVADCFMGCCGMNLPAYCQRQRIKKTAGHIANVCEILETM